LGGEENQSVDDSTAEQQAEVSTGEYARVSLTDHSGTDSSQGNLNGNDPNAKLVQESDVKHREC
jgi:hypothetical protein